MTDTSIMLTPQYANASGPMIVLATAALFTAADVGRLLSIRQLASERIAATAYTVGTIVFAQYANVPRLYRVTGAGTTAAASLAGTTPNYDLNAPRETGSAILDGTATLKYIGAGRHVWGWSTITAFTSSTQVTVNVDPRGPFAATTSSLNWRLGEYSDARGWPVAGTFFEQRLIVAGTLTKPQSVWSSQSADFENFAPSEPDGTVLDTSAITISIDDDTVNTVRWLSGFTQGLALGTASGEFVIAPANANGGLSPTNIKAKRKGDRGSDASSPPLRVGGTLAFVEIGGRKIRQLEYQFGTDSFTTVDLSQLSERITGPGIVETAFVARPDAAMWLLRSDGLIAAVTFDVEQKVRAWTLLTIQDGLVESLSAGPSPDATTTDVYVQVVRVFGGVTRRTIEIVRAPFRADLDGITGYFMVDAGLTYSGTPVTSVSGLGHLEGREVAIVADGSLRTRQTVVSGTVAVTGPASSTIHVGLPFTTSIKTLPPEAGAGGGTAQGQMKRAGKVTLRLLESLGGKVGRGTNLEQLVMRSLDEPISAAVPLFTGDKRVGDASSWDRTGQIDIVQDEPLPLTVLAIIQEITTNG